MTVVNFPSLMLPDLDHAENTPDPARHPDWLMDPAVVHAVVEVLQARLNDPHYSVERN